MSTLTLADIPLESSVPAEHLRRVAAAVRVHFTWWGVHKTLTAQQKEEVGLACRADGKLLTAGKKLIDTRHEAFRRLTTLRSRVVQYWKGLTLPYPEPGLRLLRQSDIEAFVHTLEGFRDELVEAEQALNAVFAQVQADARERLGKLYHAGDYPDEVRGRFAVDWDFPAVEPPSYLLRLNPELYRQEQQRVAERFAQAVELAEQSFVGEFAKLVQRLAERVQDDSDGEHRVFRDSAVENLHGFFDRFRKLSVRSSGDLDRLVDQAQAMVRGVTPTALRSDDGLRRQIAQDLAQVQASLETLLVERPRRRIVRMTATDEGGGHAAGD